MARRKKEEVAEVRVEPAKKSRGLYETQVQKLQDELHLALYERARGRIIRSQRVFGYTYDKKLTCVYSSDNPIIARVVETPRERITQRVEGISDPEWLVEIIDGPVSILDLEGTFVAAPYYEVKLEERGIQFGAQFLIEANEDPGERQDLC